VVVMWLGGMKVILEVTSKSRELVGEKFFGDFVRVCWWSEMGVFCMDKVVALYGVLCLLALHTRDYLRLGVVRLLPILYRSFNC